MATEISVENVCKFITDHGGKIKNTVLVSNFKKVLNDPATKDEARQRFKECVNTVAVVKTENGEKYVQLKKKFRTSTSSSGADSSINTSQSSQGEPAEPSTPTKNEDSTSVADTSFTPSENLPYADGSQHTRSPSNTSSHKSPEASKDSRSSSSTSVEKQKLVSSPKHQSSKTEETKHKDRSPVHSPKSQHPHHKKSPSHQDQESVQPKEKTTITPGAEREQKQTKKDDSTEVKPGPPSQPAPDPTFAVPAIVPLRKKKERKENVPPSPKADHSQRVDRIKSSLLSTSEQRLSRARPTSVVQGNYHGSVERVRQNFLNKQKTNDDSASLALSERSLDSKGEELDDEYNLPSVALDMNEKAWIIRSAQGNLVEMRKLLNIDSSLADKKDFIMGYSALHWAAKKGNADMVNMLIDQKVDINARSNGGYTALHIAAMHGHEEILSLLLEVGADGNIRDYSGHQAIHYLKSVSLPLQSKHANQNSVPPWKRHYHAGTKYKPSVSNEFYNLLIGRSNSRRASKALSESAKSIEADAEPVEERHRANSSGSSERKNSAGNVGSKSGKVSRTESMLKGIGIRRKTSFRKSKNNDAIPEEPVIEHPHPPPPAPSNKLPSSSGVMMWKPLGPKV